MAPLSVREHPAPPPGWDAFVRAAPGATFCHLSGWGRIMDDALGHRSRWLVAEGEGAWQGVLPLVRVKTQLFGDYLLSMPFLNDGGPLGSDDARALLASHAAERARDEGVDLMELRVREPLPDLETSQRKITVILDLPGSAEQAWDDLKSKVRSQVRRPRKEGMVFREGPGELEAFYGVFARNMRDLGTPVLPRRFFEAIRAELPDEVVFGTVYKEDEAVAAGCGFTFGDEFEITWASSLREYNREAPNMLLYWSLIEGCIERGLAAVQLRTLHPRGRHPPLQVAVGRAGRPPALGPVDQGGRERHPLARQAPVPARHEDLEPAPPGRDQPPGTVPGAPAALRAPASMRRQLPAYSPLPLRAVAHGLTAALGGTDPRPRLERLLVERYGAREAILTGSGTQALQSALAWAKAAGRVGAGVALPAFGCFDLATAVVGADVPVLFYDLEPTTLQPDPESLERALGAGAGVLVITPLFGYPVAWRSVLEAAGRHGALVVEDAAQGFGLEPTTHGALMVLSFGRGKGWTGGRGGALLVAREGAPKGDPPALLSPAPRTGPGTAARLLAQWTLGRPAFYGLPSALPWLALGETVYHEPEKPRGMDRAAAATALATLAASEEEVRFRRGTAEEIQARMEDHPSDGVRFIAPPGSGASPAYLRLPVLTSVGLGGLPNPLAAARSGVFTSYPRALPDLPPLRARIVERARDFPGAFRLVEGLLTLPCHSLLSGGEIATLAHILQEYRSLP